MVELSICLAVQNNTKVTIDVSPSALWMSNKYSGWLQCATAYLLGIKNSPTGMGLLASLAMAAAPAAAAACVAVAPYITHVLISKAWPSLSSDDPLIAVAHMSNWM